MTGRPITRRLGRWPGGIATAIDPHELQSFDPRKPSYLADAFNVDLDDAGKVTRRHGMRQLDAAPWRRLWSDDETDFALGVRDGRLTWLRYFDGQLTTKDLGSVAERPSYAALNGCVYWSDGLERGAVGFDGTPLAWGVEDPAAPSLQVLAAGGMSAGTYRVAATFATATGEQSGAFEDAVAELLDNQGLRIGLPQPTSSDVTTVRIWMSEPNGEDLYSVLTLPAGAALVDITAPVYGRALETLHAARVPPASIVRAYRGRLYLAVGDTLFFTQPLRYGLYFPARDHIRFPTPIQVVEAVDGGLYVGTEDQALFLAGDEPRKFVQTIVENVGAVSGASVRVTASTIDDQLQGMAALWWSRRGALVMGLADGTVRQVTRKTLAVPEYAAGSLMVREKDGARHVVSSLRDPGPASGFAARDYAVASVVRNGVELPEPTAFRGTLHTRVTVSVTPSYTV